MKILSPRSRWGPSESNIWTNQIWNHKYNGHDKEPRSPPQNNGISYCMFSNNSPILHQSFKLAHQLHLKIHSQLLVNARKGLIKCLEMLVSIMNILLSTHLPYTVWEKEVKQKRSGPNTKSKQQIAISLLAKGELWMPGTSKLSGKCMSHHSHIKDGPHHKTKV